MSDDSPRSTPVHSDDDSTENEENVQNTRFRNGVDSEPEGEDLYNTVRSDYRARPELDVYENEGLDNEEYEGLTPYQIAQVNSELAQRQGSSSFWSVDARNAIEARRLRNFLERPNQQIKAFDEIFEQDNGTQNIFLQDIVGPLQPYLERQEIKIEIARKFRIFIQEFKDSNGQLIYLEKIRKVATNNLESFEVSYLDLSHHNTIIGVWLGDAPDIIIPILSDAALLVVRKMYPNLDIRKITVRITHLPIIDNIRDLRQIHLDSLVRTKGVVTRCNDILPHLLQIKWRCEKCGQVHGPFEVSDEKIYPPAFCAACNSKGPFRMEDGATLYRNYQRITIQEPPNSVPPGRLPRTKEVILLDDNAGTVRPGEEIDVTGVYKHVMHTKGTGFAVFSTIIESNYILRSGDNYNVFSITEEEKEQIIKLSQSDNLEERIFNAIAPAIHGHRDIKAAIAMSLFGGTRVEEKGHTVRGDINIILLGDPGTAKSQFLQYARDIAPRSIYTTGKGASAVGLTAALHRDHASGEWTIEGGALVLADGGVCLIDEFDKMTDKDRNSLHEAMEQQTISISKGGIVTTLQARCSIIAACNPIRDRYQPSLSFLENSGLTEPILTRFDVICVVRDIINQEADENLAKFVCRNHQGYEQPAGDISRDLLKKYISYARANVHTRITGADRNKLSNLYTDLRKESEHNGGQSITVRNFESMIRLAEAHARMYLRNNVNDDDTNFAIKLVIESFLSTQKYSVQKNLRRVFQIYLHEDQGKVDMLMRILMQAIKEKENFNAVRNNAPDADLQEITIKRSDFERLANENHIESISGFFNSTQFKRSGLIYRGEDIIRPARDHN